MNGGLAAHCQCKQAELTFVPGVPRRSLLVGTSGQRGRLTCLNVSDRAEQEHGEDRFAKPALWAKTERQHWLDLVGEP